MGHLKPEVARKNYQNYALGILHFFSSITFSQPIFCHCQRKNMIMLESLFQMENMTVHISTAVSAKVAF